MAREKVIVHSISEFPVPLTYEFEVRVVLDALTSPESIPDTRSAVRESMFGDPGLRSAWSRIVSAWDAGNPLDITSLPELFPGRVSEVMAFHDGETGGVVPTLNHANMLRLQSVRRSAYVRMMGVITGSTGAGMGLDDILSAARGLVSDVEECWDGSGAVTLSGAVEELGSELRAVREANDAGRPVAVTTGFPSLDTAFLRGLRPGNLFVLAARPGVGKTSVMLKMILSAASAGFPVKVYSLEMSRTEIATKVMYALGGLTPGQTLSGRADWDGAWRDALSRCGGLKIRIDDRLCDLESIASDVMVSSQRGECGVAFIDYLGLVRVNNDHTPYQQGTEKSGRLKRLAKDCGIPIVALSQLNRESIREGREPELIDLRDSGSIEQDADKVVMLAGKTGADGNRYVDMFLRKNRMGRGGDIKIKLIPNDTFSDFREETGDLPSAGLSRMSADEDDDDDDDDDNDGFPF